VPACNVQAQLGLSRVSGSTTPVACSPTRSASPRPPVIPRSGAWRAEGAAGLPQPAGECSAVLLMYC
jgi:hypothetical protein